jgi:CIC family chloride channel protein
VGAFNPWYLILPALGGLTSGLFVQVLFRQPFGHGTDLYVRAFHRDFGQLPLRGPLVKGTAAVGVIASGGSAGPEGPIAALGAALGSTVGRLFRLSPRERRMMLVAGCGAGVGAIFRCPLGGALFATSVLYREEEFEAEAIVPAFVASVIGYSTIIELFGAESLMIAGQLTRGIRFQSAIELIPYALLGPLCALASIFFSIALESVEKARRALTMLPRWALPAIGGLATGAVACVLPQVMDGQYRFIRAAMEGFSHLPVNQWWWVGLLGAVVIAKCLATALTVGSGASGGVLGPSVFIGGAVGAFLGALLDVAAPELLATNPNLREALIPVGMGGVLAAGMRTPLAAIVMVCEMTGSYGLIVPLMLVCMSSYVIGRFRGLNPEQVRSASESPAHAGDAIVHLLESWHVRDLMDPRWEETVGPEATLPELVARIRPGTRPVFAVARGDAILGVVSVADIRRIMQEPGMAEVIIAMDMMTEDLVTVGPDEDVYDALESFRRTRHDVLPVVSAGGDARWLGMLTRARIFETLQRSIAETQQAMLIEHAGLSAIERESQLQQLVMGVSPMRKDMIQRLLVPMDAVGQSLREADFRRRYGAQVIGIEQSDGSLQCPPNLEAPLQTGQRLLAIVGEGLDGVGAEDDGPFE